MEKEYIIYRDTAFIIEFYESVKNITVPIKVTKRTNGTGGFSIGIANVGSTMEEEKEFPIPTHRMYMELLKEMAELPSANLDTMDRDAPELFWLEGTFGGSQPSISSGSGPSSSTSLFHIRQSLNKWKRIMNLVTNDAYFVSGYDQVAKHGWALTCGFGFQVRMLVRLLCWDEGALIGAPMVIIKMSNAINESDGKPS